MSRRRAEGLTLRHSLLPGIAVFRQGLYWRRTLGVDVLEEISAVGSLKAGILHATEDGVCGVRRSQVFSPVVLLQTTSVEESLAKSAVGCCNITS
jgi:hypothetical protein